MLKEDTTYLQQLKQVGHVKNCRQKINCDLMFYILIHMNFIPVQCSDDSDIYSINDSKTYYEIKHLKHKFDMFNCQSKIGSGHVAMDIIV